MIRSRPLLTAALAASTLLTAFAASADDHRRHSGRNDNDRYERRWDNRHDGRRDYRDQRDHRWEQRRDDWRDDRRHYRQGYRQGYRDGHWTVPPHHRFRSDGRYRYYSNHPGFRYGWYNGRYGRYYYQPSHYYFPPHRGAHGALIISVPLW